MKEEMSGLVALLRAMNGEQKVIEHMEKEGQMEAVSNVYLSTCMKPEQEVWEKLGFEFTDIPNDTVLCQCKLPEGWKLIPSEKWTFLSYLVDQFDNVRGEFFYKSAFYDRHSDMKLKTRYNIGYDFFETEDGVEYREVYFGNSEEKIFVAGRVKENCLDNEFYVELNKLEHIVKEWADEHYPDWQDVGAYWDSEEKKTNNPIKTLK